MTIRQTKGLTAGSIIFDADGCSYEVQSWRLIDGEQLLVKHVCDNKLQRIPLDQLLTDDWLTHLSSPPDLRKLQL